MQTPMRETCEYRLKLPGNPDGAASFALIDTHRYVLHIPRNNRKITADSLKIFGIRTITVDQGHARETVARAIAREHAFLIFKDTTMSAGQRADGRGH